MLASAWCAHRCGRAGPAPTPATRGCQKRVSNAGEAAASRQVHFCEVVCGVPAHSESLSKPDKVNVRVTACHLKLNLCTPPFPCRCWDAGCSVCTLRRDICSHTPPLRSSSQGLQRPRALRRHAVRGGRAARLGPGIVLLARAFDSLRKSCACCGSRMHSGRRARRAHHCLRRILRWRPPHVVEGTEAAAVLPIAALRSRHFAPQAYEVELPSVAEVFGPKALLMSAVRRCVTRSCVLRWRGEHT